jgi:AraC-like DNA-binding protein
MNQSPPPNLEVRIVKFPVSSVYMTFLLLGQKYHYAIIAVIEGTIEFTEYEVSFLSRARDICFVNRATLVRALTYEPVKLFVVEFTNQFAMETLYAVHSATVANLFSAVISKVTADNGTFRVIKKLLLLLYKHRQGKPSVNSPVISQLTFNLLLSCIAELKDVTVAKGLGTTNYRVLVAINFLRYVEEYSAIEHGVKFYAAKMNMSQGNLSRIVRAITGLSPKVIIEKSLVVKAKKLLEESLSSIYILAEELGFKSSSAFINFFRFHTSLTPNEYRNSNTR